MDRLFICKGENVLYLKKRCVIIKVIDVTTVSIEEVETNIIHTVNVNNLYPDIHDAEKDYDLHSISEKDWDKANKRYEIIKPILNDRGNFDLVSEISRVENVGVATLYRWVKAYDKSGLVSSLAGKKRTGGIGKSRLTHLQENIIQDKINKIYLNNSRRSITKTINEVKLECDSLSIPYPHPNTIRNRIKMISEEEKIKKRLGIQEARYKFEPQKGNFPGADYPLAVVQIDHTTVDIILVDEISRKPLKRPWLTAAIDVYSRMVIGFYMSFDNPGYLGTGMCIANSILPKEMWLEQLGIAAEWPCWGIMDMLHLDNAKEFRGEMLKKVCQNYAINLEFRPVGQPHFGGHIERLMGTFASEIHNLPGTTFSNVEERKKYESEKNASFTLPEFEKWLTIFITKIYHMRKHEGIGVPPLQRFKDGIMGSKTSPGRGIPPRINDERKVKLDFMPFVERSIQEYGIVIDHIFYYSDALRNYIHDMEGNQVKKHIFKRDPRDISVVYFFEPDRGSYIEIPYRDASLPPISIWEHREIVRRLQENKIDVDEKSIFTAYRELNEIENRAIRETRERKKNQDIPATQNSSFPLDDITPFDVDIDEEITPFEDIDDEAFIR
jgi:putative transposase